MPNFGPSGVASPTETILFSRTPPTDELQTVDTFARQPDQLYGAPFSFLLNSDAPEDGGGDGAVGTGGNSPAENVALKFVCAHLSGVVIVGKR